MVIPELIRLLGEKGIAFEEAVKIVTKTCAYTNHTILAEALEKWPRAYLDAVVPQLMPIIEQLDALARSRTADESLAIIDKDNRVHMAHMDIHFTHSTNLSLIHICVQPVLVQIFSKALPGHFLEPPHKMAWAAPAGGGRIGHVQFVCILLVDQLHHDFQAAGVGGIGGGPVSYTHLL